MWLWAYELNCERNPPRASRAAVGYRRRLYFRGIAPEILARSSFAPRSVQNGALRHSEYKKAGP